MHETPRSPRFSLRTKLAAGLVLVAAAVIAGLVLSPDPSARPRESEAAEAGIAPEAADDRSAPEAAEDRESAAPAPTGEPRPPIVYELGLSPADVDTSLAEYLTSPGGITEQCDALNEVIASVCCPEFDTGCNVRYVCERLSVDERDLMTRTAYLYSRERGGEPNYALHHGSVQDQITRHFRTLQLYGRVSRRIPVAYTRHHLQIDDHETRNKRSRVDRADPAFRLLGSILPGVSDRGGTRILLDYYASRDGLLLSVRPVSQLSLAKAIAEFRANLFSFAGKEFTGRGARDLFEPGTAHKPRLSGCQALAIREPAHLRSFLQAEPQ